MDPPGGECKETFVSVEPGFAGLVSGALGGCLLVAPPASHPPKPTADADFQLRTLQKNLSINLF